MYLTIALLAGIGAILLYYVIKKSVLAALKENGLLDERERREAAPSDTLKYCLEKKCRIQLAKECRFGSSLRKEIEGTVISLDPAWLGIMYEGEDCQAEMNIIRIAFIDTITVMKQEV